MTQYNLVSEQQVLVEETPQTLFEDNNDSIPLHVHRLPQVFSSHLECGQPAHGRAPYTGCVSLSLPLSPYITVTYSLFVC